MPGTPIVCLAVIGGTVTGTDHRNRRFRVDLRLLPQAERLRFECVIYRLRAHIDTAPMSTYRLQ